MPVLRKLVICSEECYEQENLAVWSILSRCPAIPTLEEVAIYKFAMHMRDFTNFILKHKGVVNWGYPAAGVAVLLGVAVWLAPVSRPAAPVAEAPAATAPAAAAEGSASTPAAAGQASAAAAGSSDFAKVQAVVTARCYQCHSAHPTLMPSPAKGVLLDTPEELGKHAQLVYQQVVQQKLMPLGNVTQITDDERTIIAKWFEGGAKTN